MTPKNPKLKRKMRILLLMLIGISIFAVGVKLLFQFTEMSHAREMMFVPGPENPSLLEQAKGIFIYRSGDSGKLEALSLPDKKKYPISLQGVPIRPYLIAGPDKDGRFAYFSHGEGDEFLKKYYLIIASLKNEKPEVLYTHEGKLPHLNRDMEEALALSHTGGHLAFINQEEYYNKDSNSWDVRETLDIWDINQKKKIDSIEGVLGYGFSWFSDGQRIAYERNGIQVYDLQTKKETQIVPLEEGNPVNPIVRFDGKKIIFYRYYQEKSYIIDLDTKEEKEISLPGLFGYGGESAYLGFPALNLVAFRALPTQGDTSAGWTTNNSPFVGEKPLTTIKISDFNTGQFQTIISGIDPRSPVSYGFMNEEPINVSASQDFMEGESNSAPAQKKISLNAQIIIVIGGIIILVFVILIFWFWQRYRKYKDQKPF